MKSIICLLLLSFCLFAVAKEECFDKQKVMDEYKAHEADCKKSVKDEKDKTEMIGCIFGKYECTENGKVNYDTLIKLVNKKIDKSESKRNTVVAGVDKCKADNPVLEDHPFWSCIGKVFETECMA